MTRTAHRLPRWQRRMLYTSGTALLASGLAWLVLHYAAGAGAGELPHPLEAWTMRLHGLAAFAGLFMLGVVADSHIPRGWRMSAPVRPRTEFRSALHEASPMRRRHRWARQRHSGVWLATLGGALALTGYLLYYFAPETLRPALGWLHSGLGVAMGGVLLEHQRRKSRHGVD
jgi:hypothetical protein